MKRKIIVSVIASIIILAILFVPVPLGSYDDGGTREYVALTYKIIDWKRLTYDGLYEKTRVYFGKDYFKRLDELWEKESDNVNHKFIATVIEKNGTSVLVEPVEGEPELYSTDRISFSCADLAVISAKAGSVVEITYKGGIMESYPAQINAINWQISKDLRHIEYSEKWIDKNTATKYDNNIFNDVIITEIYSNCFFAQTVIPMPYTIKFNGSLSNEWCVGDQIICKYENTYYDEESNRVEVDLISLAASDWEPDPYAAYKPVIYLYPEKETEVFIKLTPNGKFISTYPEYNDGWKITASPDGTLTDEKGMAYNYLFWEAELNTKYDLTKGFCVKGEDTAAFLEEALSKLGLTRREANEFIVFWLPFMENNPYNIISFQTDPYTESAKLEISPTPDTLIRVFMAWQASDDFIEIQEQELSSPERIGFTAIEWGGTEIK